MGKPLVHLLNYGILQKWGFEWATKRNDDDVVDSYYAETKHTDMHDFRPLLLLLLPNLNTGRIWHISIMAKRKKDSKVLFQGVINDDKTLKCILKAVIVFNPNNKEE